jgi:hypothetical protein
VVVIGVLIVVLFYMFWILEGGFNVYKRS